MKRHFLPVIAVLTLWALSATIVHADYTIDVTLNTSKLSSDSSLTGPFGIGFDMNSGGSAFSNTADISDFNFGTGGSAGSGPFTSGNASGSLTAGVSMEVDPVNSESYFDQGFTPGSTLSFQINLSSNVGSTPDTLAFFLIQNYAPGSLFTGNNGANGTSPSTQVPTSDPTGSDNLLVIQITPNPSNPNAPIINVYGGSDPSGDPPPPQVDVVPEPSTLTLAFIGVVGVVGGCWRRWKRVA